MANDNSNDYIPIGQGLRVRFANERALHEGCPESEVLSRVELWLRCNPEHVNRARVKMWREQKIKQIELDRQEQLMKGKRASVDAGVRRAVRRSALLSGHEDLSAVRFIGCAESQKKTSSFHPTSSVCRDS